MTTYIGIPSDTQTHATRFDNGSTLTNGRTDGLTHDHQDSGSNSQVPDAPRGVDKWVIRKRFSFMYGSPGLYWRVYHPSLPAYFGHSLHLYSWQDALDYALASVAGDYLLSTFAGCEQAEPKAEVA
jgi:hypothetical protein